MLLGEEISNSLETRFFFSSKAFFQEHLINGYLMSDDTIGNVAESACAAVVESTCLHKTAPRPLLTGFSGGTARQYDEVALGKLDDAFPCWRLT